MQRDIAYKSIDRLKWNSKKYSNYSKENRKCETER